MFRSSRVRVSLFILAIVGLSVIVFVNVNKGQAVAAGSTPVQVVVTGPVTGTISISATSTTVSTTANSTGGATSATLAIGPVDVIESRSNTPGWTASVTSTDLSSGSNSIVAGGLTYTPGTVTASVNLKDVTAQVAGVLHNTTPYSAVIALSTALKGTFTWSPSIAVAIANNLASGTYAGTITHSVA